MRLRMLDASPDSSTNRLKSKRIKILQNIVVSLLLLLLGVVVGYRYAIGNPVAGLKLGFLDSLAKQQRQEQLQQLVKDSAAGPVSMDVFWETWQILERDYLKTEQIDYEQMLDGAISGMVRGVGDPYTTYLSPAANEQAEGDLAGSFYGVGIELDYINGMVGVIAPLAGNPAEQAGIQAGDIILHVKDDLAGLDEDTDNWTLDDAVQHIRGARGTSVTLTIFREGEETSREFSLVRDEVIVDSVTVDFLELAGKQLAHIQISRFGERTEAEWDRVVAQILTRWANRQLDGIILDLRNNPGGYFETSIDIASDFVSSGVVVSQKTKYNQQDFKTRGSARLQKIPTVVLVNKGSASASEIVAGALRDDLGIKLVGEATFGKGTVQDRRELSNGGGLHVTVGQWLTPSGNWIQDSGLPVDIEVSQDYNTEADEVLDRAAQEF